MHRDIIYLNEEKTVIDFPRKIGTPRTLDDLASNGRGIDCAALVYIDNNGAIKFQCTPLMDWNNLMRVCSYIQYVGNVIQDRSQTPKNRLA